MAVTVENRLRSLFVERKSSFVARFGPMFEVPELKVQDPFELWSANEIVGIWANGVALFPSFNFDKDGNPVPVIGQLLKQIAISSTPTEGEDLRPRPPYPVMFLDWWYKTPPYVAGALSPKQMFEQGLNQDLVQAGAKFGERLLPRIYYAH